MNCSTFRDGLNQSDGSTLSADMVEHAANCPACKTVLAGEERISRGMAVLRKTPVPAALRKNIMNRVAQEPAPQGRWNPFFLLVDLFRITSPMKAVLVYSLSGLVIFGLCYRILISAGDRRQQQLSAPIWEMTLSRGSAQFPGGEAVPGRLFRIESDQEITLSPTAEAHLTYPGRSEIRLSAARFQVAADRLSLFSGAAHVKVFPALQPTASQFSGDSGVKEFKVLTPLGEITVLGTEFSVILSDQGLQVNVITGKIRIVSEAATRVLETGQVAVIRPPGETISRPATPSVGAFRPGISSESTSITPIGAPASITLPTLPNGPPVNE
jgi:hypothetical protein